MLMGDTVLIGSWQGQCLQGLIGAPDGDDSEVQQLVATDSVGDDQGEEASSSFSAPVPDAHLLSEEQIKLLLEPFRKRADKNDNLGALRALRKQIKVEGRQEFFLFLISWAPNKLWTAV